MRINLKQLLWEWRGVLIAAPSVAVLVMGLRLVGLLQTLELTALDKFFRWLPLEPTDSRIVIVEINEEDIRNTGHWPISDSQLAKLWVRA